MKDWTIHFKVNQTNSIGYIVVRENGLDAVLKKFYTIFDRKIGIAITSIVEGER